MHLIITDARMAQSRVIHLGLVHGVLAALALLALLCLLAWALVRQQGHAPQALVSAREPPAWGLRAVEATQERERALRASVDAMARRVGEMQVRLIQLESLDERLRGLAGLPPLPVGQAPGQGGALVRDRPLTLPELNAALDELASRADLRNDRMLAIESRLVDQQVRTRMLPSQVPVEGRSVGSPFGTRIDPINGHAAHHTGLDFPAPVGTAIAAAAGGVVIVQQFHPEYGNMVEIAHGNDLVTRYAHSSKVFVKAGDLVRQGQKIAEVGTSGRSTGPHLHFEVLQRGVVQDPQDFLFGGRGTAPVSAVAAQVHRDAAARQ